jgi:3,4-dihydroxy 2-butanone 4-phosphate synthase/GTP cyclohydrolase II
VILLLNCEQAGKDLLSYLESLNAPAQTITNQKTLRYYGIGAQILRHIGIKKMRLLSAPATMPSLAGFGIELTGYIEH